MGRFPGNSLSSRGAISAVKGTICVPISPTTRGGRCGSCSKEATQLKVVGNTGIYIYTPHAGLLWPSAENHTGELPRYNPTTQETTSRVVTENYRPAGLIVNTQITGDSATSRLSQSTHREPKQASIRVERVVGVLRLTYGGANAQQVACVGVRALLQNFLSIIVDVFVRCNADYGRYWPEDYSTTADAWMQALVEDSPVVEESDANLSAFCEQYRAWAEPVSGTVGRADGIRFASASDWFHHQRMRMRRTLLCPNEQVWRERGSTLKFLNRKFDAPQERLLAGLGQASRIFTPIEFVSIGLGFA